MKIERLLILVVNKKQLWTLAPRMVQMYWGCRHLLSEPQKNRTDQTIEAPSAAKRKMTFC
jgi:hypothetical protein